MVIRKRISIHSLLVFLEVTMCLVRTIVSISRYVSINYASLSNRKRWVLMRVCLQIVLYIFARVVLAAVKIPVKRQIIDAPQHTYPVFAAVCWGLVMYLFKHDADTLQPSLRSSMQYIYKDSDSWNSLRTLIWHNK